MKNNVLATTIILVLVSLEIGFAEIVTKPSVTEIVVGGSTFLNCSTNSKQDIHWFHTPFGSNAVRKLVYGYDKIYTPYDGRFHVEKNEDFGAYNLVIQSVKVDDAGVYDGQEGNGTGKIESAELIVLDTNPICEPHLVTLEIIGPNNCGIEPNQLILSCKVRYRGNEAPILEWRRSIDNKSVIEGVTRGTIDNSLVMYNLTIEGNSAVKDGDSYHCYTTRSTTMNTGCKSGKIEVKGGVTPEVCKPYVNPYKAAVIFLVILLIAIVGIVLWYLRIYKPRHPNQDVVNVATTRDTGTEEETDSLCRPTSSRGNVVYLDKPVLAHTIEFSEKKEGKSEKNKAKTISGVTILGTELFVVTKCSQEIQVYDSKTFQHQRTMEIGEITDPMDLASSKDVNCLYVVGRFNDESESKILRFDPTGKVIQRWPTGGGKGRLSTYGSNVILCLLEKQLIDEYSPDGELIARVRLSPAAELNNPQHAIKVASEYFFVSQGDYEDELHRVCVVDLDGNIKRECKTWEKPTVTSRATMKVPICLLEDSDGSIIVADADHSRILLLSSMLTFQRRIIEDGSGRILDKNSLTDFPARLSFDDTLSRLFVGVNKWSSSKEGWKDGRILIFNIK